MNLVTIGSCCFLLFACTESKFKGSAAADKNDSALAADQLPAWDNFVAAEVGGELAEPFRSKGGDFAIRIENIQTIKVDGSQLKKPLSIYFAIDRSGSMSRQIESVKSSVKNFALSLQKEGFDARFGAVVFNDGIDDILPLSPLAPFEVFIGQLSVAQGVDVQNFDAPEGSLLAINTAHANIMYEETRSGAIRAIVAITDATGHMGGKGEDDGIARRCDPLGVSNTLKTPAVGAVKFFYSVSSDYIEDPCESYSSASMQFAAILNDVKLAAPADTYVGSALKWPFTAATLTQELTPKLVLTLDSQDLQCTVKSVKLLHQGQVLGTWDSQQLAAGTDGNSVIAKNPQLLETLQPLGGQMLDLDITRCCPQNGQACAVEKQQSVSFKLEVSP